MIVLARIQSREKPCRYEVAFLVIAVLLLITHASGAAASDVTGKVISVADGDTITILTAEHEQLRIRLAEIDAHDGGQPFGRRTESPAPNLPQ